MNGEDSFLTCKVCKGTYDDPRILPCFHTFCFQCLGSCLTYKKRKTSSSSTTKLTCPLCQLAFDFIKKEFNGIEKNSHILKCISYLPTLNASREAKCDYREEDLNHFIKLLLKEIQQEIRWTFENLNVMNSNFKELKKSALNEKERIESFASAAHREKNRKELLDEIDASIKEEEDVIESIRINWTVYRFGLQHHDAKIKECKDKDSTTDHVKLVLSDCRCFLDISSDLKKFSRRKSLKQIEFLKYPDNSCVLGKLCHIRNVDERISHIDADGRLSIVSMLRFSKKLRTVAYCYKRSELFLLFSSCKDILILSAESSSMPQLSMSAQEGSLDTDGNIVAFDDSRAGRKIIAVNLNDANDSVVCSNYLFISERSNNNLHRISLLEGCQQAKYWNTGSYNNGLSVTPVETILVACNSTKCIIEYAVDGFKLRTVNLAPLLNPRHALFLPMEFAEKHSQRYSQLRDSTSQDIEAQADKEIHYNHFSVCLAGAKHEIIITDSSGKTTCCFLQHSEKLNYPIHLTLVKCNSEPSFVACDRFNRRFLLLDRDLMLLTQLHFVFGSTELEREWDIFGFEYTETSYESCHGTGETYRVKCPSKSLLTEQGELFIVDEDNSSLLKLVNSSGR